MTSWVAGRSKHPPSEDSKRTGGDVDVDYCNAYEVRPGERMELLEIRHLCPNEVTDWVRKMQRMD
jgi:hypothetical protein